MSQSIMTVTEKKATTGSHKYNFHKKRATEPKDLEKRLYKRESYNLQQSLYDELVISNHYSIECLDLKKVREYKDQPGWIVVSIKYCNIGQLIDFGQELGRIKDTMNSFGLYPATLRSKIQ